MTRGTGEALSRPRIHTIAILRNQVSLAIALFAIVQSLLSTGCQGSGPKSEPGMLFTRHPQPFVAPLGDEVYFECSVSPAADRFAWRHRALGASRWLALDAGPPQQGKTSKFVVNFDSEAKAGDYRCVAFYGTSGLASDPARLTQARIERFADRADLEIRVAPGNNVPITCPAPYSVPDAVVQFYKDGSPLMQNASLTGGRTILLERVTVADSGSYHCEANNYITSETYTSNYKTLLQVMRNISEQQPYFLRQPQHEYRVLRGKNATLECFAAGFPPPRATWSKLGSALPARSSYSALGLTITNVQPNDRGEYDCVWSNQHNRIRSVIVLTVVEPPTVNRPPKQSTFPEGGDLELSCNATGYPTPQIEWLINGDTLQPSKNIDIRGSVLSIANVEKKHAGIVQCVASNEYGSNSGYNFLRVSPKQHLGGPKTRVEYGMGNSGHKHTRGGGRRRKDGKRKGTVLVPPDTPNVTRLSDVSVMVRWSVPEKGGLPIQFFKVQYREICNGGGAGGCSGGQRSTGKQAKWMTLNSEIPSHVRSFEVGDLTPNRTYRFRVAAVHSNNDNTISPISTRFQLNRDGGFERNRMPIPLLTHTEALGPHEVLMLWQNSDRSADIDGFYVYHRASTFAGDYVKTTVEGKNATNITISHLQPETTYEFKVQSFSVDAASEFSQIFRQKTKKLVVVDTGLQQVTTKNEIVPLEKPKYLNIVAIVGGIFGGIVLLSGLGAIGYAYKKQRQKQSRETSQDQGKPIANGRMMNGGIHDSKMNITSNPLAGIESTEDPMQPKSGQPQQPSMEMASFLNGQPTLNGIGHPSPQEAANGPATMPRTLNTFQNDSMQTPAALQATRPIEQPL